MKKTDGVHRGVVVETQDPQRLGRVQVSLPAVDEILWAPLVTLSAGAGYGSWFIPEVGTEVLVAFESGDIDQPYVLGSLWTANDRPPETDPGRTVLRTRHGATVVLDDGAGSVEIEDANGNAVRLSPAGVRITAAAKLQLDASEIELSAATVTVSAGSALFSGVVECDTLIATNVVAESYTPGSGNAL